MRDRKLLFSGIGRAVFFQFLFDCNALRQKRQLVFQAGDLGRLRKRHQHQTENDDQIHAVGRRFNAQQLRDPKHNSGKDADEQDGKREQDDRYRVLTLHLGPTAFQAYMKESGRGNEDQQDSK